MSTQEECLQILNHAGIDPDSEIDFDVNGTVKSLSLQYIIDTFMLASQDSQLVFLSALKKSRTKDTLGIDQFFEGMGQLLLMSHLSENFTL